MSIAEEAEYVGEAHTKWSYTQIRDWMLICPDISHTALRLYSILRSMIIEKGDEGLRRLTIDQLCWLLPGPNGKETSRTAVKDAMRVLLDKKLLECTDDDAKNPSGPRKYIVKDFPPKEYEGWRNAWDKLNAYTPDWRKQAPKAPVAQNGTNGWSEKRHPGSTGVADEGEVVGKTTTGGRKNDHGGRNSVADEPLTSDSGSLKKPSLKNPPPQAFRAGAREDATPEAPLEDEEEMKSYDEDPSPEARAHYEGESEEGTAENGPDGLQEGLEGVRRFIASLPGLEGAQEGAYGFLEYPVAEALAAGWTEQALKATLIRHTDVRQARNPGVIPSWYANAFSKIGEAPKPVVPLCAHPGHARNPVSDPVNGGCLPCNTVLRQAPAVPVRRERIEPVSSDDVVSAADLIRQAMRNRKFDAREPSRRQMPGHRAKDQADQARRQAGELLRGE